MREEGLLSVSALRASPPLPLTGARKGAWIGGLAALIPADAFAHASERGHVLLLPTGHYLLGGALAVAASFVVLLFVSRQALERLATARLRIGGLPEVLRLPLSLISFGMFVVLVAAGFFGSRDPLSNPLPLVVWSLLWVGLTLVQGLFGNLWAWINPWYGPWRVVSAVSGRSQSDASPPRLPSWVGMWPAVLLFLAFAWFELIYPAPDDPERLAWAVGVYWLASFVMMLAFGHEKWSTRGEFLSVFFGMVAKFGLFERADGRLSLCLPGAKLANTPALPFERHALPAFRARLGILRRPVEDLFLVRAERAEPARISRTYGIDDDQQPRPTGQLCSAGGRLPPLRLCRRMAGR